MRPGAAASRLPRLSPNNRGQPVKAFPEGEAKNLPSFLPSGTRWAGGTGGTVVLVVLVELEAIDKSLRVR